MAFIDPRELVQNIAEPPIGPLMPPPDDFVSAVLRTLTGQPRPAPSMTQAEHARQLAVQTPFMMGMNRPSFNPIPLASVGKKPPVDIGTSTRVARQVIHENNLSVDVDRMQSLIRDLVEEIRQNYPGALRSVDRIQVDPMNSPALQMGLAGLYNPVLTRSWDSSATIANRVGLHPRGVGIYIAPEFYDPEIFKSIVRHELAGHGLDNTAAAVLSNRYGGAGWLSRGLPVEAAMVTDMFRSPKVLQSRTNPGGFDPIALGLDNRLIAEAQSAYRSNPSIYAYGDMDPSHAGSVEMFATMVGGGRDNLRRFYPTTNALVEALSHIARGGTYK